VNKKHQTHISPGFNKGCDNIQQKEGTDSPMSKDLRCINNPKLFACDVSVYKHFSHFYSQHNHKLYQPKNLKCIGCIVYLS